MTKKGAIITGVIVIIVIALLSPKIYQGMQERAYLRNHVFSYFSLAEFTLLDKYADGDTYYLELSIDGYYASYFNMEDNNIRVYSLGDNEELFDSIDVNNSENYTGIAVQSKVAYDRISEEEAEDLREDPLIILSKEEYSEFIEILRVY